MRTILLFIALAVAVTLVLIFVTNIVLPRILVTTSPYDNETLQTDCQLCLSKDIPSMTKEDALPFYHTIASVEQKEPEMIAYKYMVMIPDCERNCTGVWYGFAP